MSEYRFVDKDPVVDMIRTAVYESRMKIGKIAEEAGVCQQTISNWLYGDVKRPQSYTIYRVCKALGIEVRYVYSTTGELVIARDDLAEVLAKAKADRHRAAIKPIGKASAGITAETIRKIVQADNNVTPISAVKGKTTTLIMPKPLSTATKSKPKPPTKPRPVTPTPKDRKRATR